MKLNNCLNFGLISLTLISLSACTETVVREIPVSSQNAVSAQQSPLTPLDTANGQSGQPATVSTPSPSTTPTQSITTSPQLPLTTELDDSLEPQTVVAATSLINLSDTQDGSVVGLPGVAVDCEDTLPCRWISEDEGFAITVTNADNIAALGGLSLQFRVNTLHDTSVSLATSPRATDAQGVSYIVATQSLGLGNGISPSSLIAGIPITGALNYSNGAESSTLALAGISVLDNGFLRDAVFMNIPVGSVQQANVDCAFSLPCTLTLPDGQSAVTLLSAGGFSTSGSLVANFIVEVSADTQVALDAGTTAYGNEGSVFEGRTHSLRNEQGFSKVSQLARAGSPLPGTVNFSRISTQPTSLTEIHLILYRDSPVPRWNPTFFNVPLI